MTPNEPPPNGEPRPAEMETEGEGRLRPGRIAHQLYDVPPVSGRAYRRRLALLALGLVLLFLLIWARLIYLQLVRGAEFRRECDTTIRATQPLPSHRGAIRLRGGQALAVDEPTFDLALAYPCLVMNGKWLAAQARLHDLPDTPAVLRRIEATWDGLAELTATPEEELRAIAGDIIQRVQSMKDRVGRAAGRPVTIYEETIAHPIVSDVDLALVEEVLERRDRWIGVEVQVRSRRRYPRGALAAHVLGYMLRVSDAQLRDLHESYRGDPRRAYQLGEPIGAAGIEAAMNFDLRGRHGSAEVIVNARGDVQETLDRLEPEPGRDVLLTLDAELQAAAESALAAACHAQETAGAIAVLSVRTGEVLALASCPTFDPSSVRQEWDRLVQDPAKPLLNRAIGQHYPAGSIFKVVDSIAAFESRTISEGTRFTCQHRFEASGRLFGCEGSHGEIEYTTALAKSCNIYFYQVALATGQPRILEWAYRLGLGRRTGIEVPGEVPGILPRPNTYRASTCNLAIGQGEVAVTPLQVAAMMATVASGRRVRPTVFAAGDAKAPEPLGVSPSTLKALRHALREVVRTGTARRTGFDEVMSVAGKTGTAEVGIEGREPHAWFAGYAPAEAPEIAFAVLLENGGHGGETAAPVARDFLRAYATERPLRTALLTAPSAGTAETPHQTGTADERR